MQHFILRLLTEILELEPWIVATGLLCRQAVVKISWGGKQDCMVLPEHFLSSKDL